MTSCCLQAGGNWVLMVKVEAGKDGCVLGREGATDRRMRVLVTTFSILRLKAF